MRQEQVIRLSHADLEGFMSGKAIKLDGHGPGGGLLTLMFDTDGVEPVIHTNGRSISPRRTNGNGTRKVTLVSPRTRKAYRRGPYKNSKAAGRLPMHRANTYGPGKRVLPKGFRCKRGCNKSFAGKPGVVYANHIRFAHPKKGR